jgi:hypothetical protein
MPKNSPFSRCRTSLIFLKLLLQVDSWILQKMRSHQSSIIISSILLLSQFLYHHHHHHHHHSNNSHLIMCRGPSSSMTSRCPATRALNQAFVSLPVSPSITKSSSRTSLKRSRSDGSDCSFDVSSLVEATLPIEESLAFPTISWDNFSSSDEEEEAPQSPAPKRRCTGLRRIQPVHTDLFALGGEDQPQTANN